MVNLGDADALIALVRKKPLALITLGLSLYSHSFPLGYEKAHIPQSPVFDCKIKLRFLPTSNMPLTSFQTSAPSELSLRSMRKKPHVLQESNTASDSAAYPESNLCREFLLSGATGKSGGNGGCRTFETEDMMGYASMLSQQKRDDAGRETLYVSTEPNFN